MGNAAVLYDNLADTGVIVASSWIASAPPTRLQNAHVSRRWSGRNGTSEHLILDLGSVVSIDTVALFGLQAIVNGVQANMPDAVTTQLRISAADPSGVAGDVYDNGAATGRVSQKFGCLIHVLAAPVSGRYVRIDMSYSAASALLAGRMVVGLRQRFSINFQYGWSAAYEDLSRLVSSAGGQTFIDRDDVIRTLTLNFDFMPESDRDGFVDEMNRLNGASKDILFIIDPESSNLARDTIWGLKPPAPVSQPIFETFAMPVTIRERR